MLREDSKLYRLHDETQAIFYVFIDRHAREDSLLSASYMLVGYLKQ